VSRPSSPTDLLDPHRAATTLYATSSGWASVLLFCQAAGSAWIHR